MSESSASETLGQLPRTYRFGQRTGLNYTTESAVDADLSGIGVRNTMMFPRMNPSTIYYIYLGIEPDHWHY